MDLAQATAPSLNVTTLYLRPGNLKVLYKVDKHMLVCHAQASIYDRRLLESIEENPCFYFEYAFIQMWLLFKYMCTIIGNRAYAFLQFK